MGDELHSAAFFGPERDFWWNHDHLQLIAERRGLASVHSVLDVGSGVGHWGRLVASLVAPGATVVGVEREPAWVSEATRRAGGDPRFSYLEGVAEQLPFADDTFDLVTCQTVLIHVADPSAVIREFLRVTKPGGQVLVSEPNNRASYVVDTSAAADVVDALGFVYTCERGKVALGEGNGSLGDLVPGLFAQAGLERIESWLSDKTAMLVPPYAGEEQQVFRQHQLDEARDATWGWTRAEAERYYVAGGGTDFAGAWERRMAESRAAAAAVEAGTFHSAGGMLLYLIAGNKPAASGVATPMATGYQLGSSAEELDRLNRQARVLAPATRTILTLAGIEPGMRVLDLGSGAGDVSFLVASLVGSTGSVLGVDASPDAVAHARKRGSEFANVEFVVGDVHEARTEGPFDAVVGRLVLMYTRDPAAVLRTHAATLRPGGLVVPIEFDLATSGSVPAAPLSEQAVAWLREAFARGGVEPALGPRLWQVLTDAGLEPAGMIGVQPFLGPGNADGPATLAGVLRSALPLIVGTGVATADQVGPETLEQRLADELAGAVVTFPQLVGAWARTF